MPSPFVLNYMSPSSCVLALKLPKIRCQEAYICVELPSCSPAPGWSLIMLLQCCFRLNCALYKYVSSSWDDNFLFLYLDTPFSFFIVYSVWRSSPVSFFFFDFLRQPGLQPVLEVIARPKDQTRQKTNWEILLKMVVTCFPKKQSKTGCNIHWSLIG